MPFQEDMNVAKKRIFIMHGSSRITLSWGEVTTAALVKRLGRILVVKLCKWHNRGD